MHCDVCHGMGTVLRVTFPTGWPQPRPCTRLRRQRLGALLRGRTA